MGQRRNSGFGWFLVRLLAALVVGPIGLGPVLSLAVEFGAQFVYGCGDFVFEGEFAVLGRIVRREVGDGDVQLFEEFAGFDEFVAADGGFAVGPSPDGGCSRSPRASQSSPKWRCPSSLALESPSAWVRARALRRRGSLDSIGALS